jgi:phosphoenolpyruvate---glycerone phosphotransferase subunit DhaL
MSTSIDREALIRMLRGAAGLIRQNHDLLTKYDSAGGDGDHGTTMVRAMDKLEQAIKDGGDTPMKDLLQAIGWAVMGTDGGATGPLWGTFFSGMSDGVAAETLDAVGLANAFEAGLRSLQKQTKAKVGDKTMMDALIPAVEAARKAADAGQSPAGALAQAAQAAKSGAESTKAIAAKFGRARNVGDKSIGTPDAGATSVALVFQGMAEAVK